LSPQLLYRWQLPQVLYCLHVLQLQYNTGRVLPCLCLLQMRKT
jgi:hypothetical protein